MVYSLVEEVKPVCTLIKTSFELKLRHPLDQRALGQTGQGLHSVLCRFYLALIKLQESRSVASVGNDGMSMVRRKRSDK